MLCVFPLAHGIGAKLSKLIDRYSCGKSKKFLQILGVIFVQIVSTDFTIWFNNMILSLHDKKQKHMYMMMVCSCSSVWICLERWAFNVQGICGIYE